MRVRVIGIGNEFRGDDAAGLHVIRHLEAERLSGLELMELDGEATALMDAMQDVPVVVLVDAVQSRADAGTVHCWESVSTLPLGQTLRCSTHAMGLAEALELARALDRLPPHVAVIGIEGAGFDPGTAMSDVVRQAVPRAADRLLDLLEFWPPTP